MGLISPDMLVHALVAMAGSRAGLARLMGVSPGRIRRWLRGEPVDDESLRQLETLEFATRRLLRVYEPETAVGWLTGSNAHLRHARPIDLLMMGRLAEVLDAIEASDACSYA